MELISFISCFARGNFDEAIEKLHKIKDLEVSSLAVKGKHYYYIYSFIISDEFLMVKWVLNFTFIWSFI